MVMLSQAMDSQIEYIKDNVILYDHFLKLKKMYTVECLRGNIKLKLK